jgi:hypothetical protein
MKLQGRPWITIVRFQYSRESFAIHTRRIGKLPQLSRPSWTAGHDSIAKCDVERKSEHVKQWGRVTQGPRGRVACCTATLSRRRLVDPCLLWTRRAGDERQAGRASRIGRAPRTRISAPRFRASARRRQPSAFFTRRGQLSAQALEESRVLPRAYFLLLCSNSAFRTLDLLREELCHTQLLLAASPLGSCCCFRWLRTELLRRPRPHP